MTRDLSAGRVGIAYGRPLKIRDFVWEVIWWDLLFSTVACNATRARPAEKSRVTVSKLLYTLSSYHDFGLPVVQLYFWAKYDNNSLIGTVSDRVVYKGDCRNSEDYVNFAKREVTLRSSWTCSHSSLHSYIECDNVLQLPVITNIKMEPVCFSQ